MNPHAVTFSIQAAYPWITVGAQILIILAIFMGAMLAAQAARKSSPKAIGTFVRLLVLAIACAMAVVVCVCPPLVLSKAAFIVVNFTCGSIFIYCSIFCMQRWQTDLINTQKDCDLAANLVFLQGEMARAQLQSLSERLRHAIQPDERDITESMLRSISPFVMLFFRKERSILKWSLAAANIGKDLFKYFVTPNSR